MTATQGSAWSTRTLSEQEYGVWDALVARSPQGSAYCLSQYLDIYCSAFGGSFSIVGAFEHEELRGGVAYHCAKHRIGNVISNRLLLFYNSLVLDNFPSSYPSQQTAKVLGTLSALEAALGKLPAARLLLHNHPALTDLRVFQKEQWQLSPSYTYIAPLANLDAQLGKVDKNLRRLIRRCEEAGCQLSDDEDFESFFAAHEGTHDRKGSPLYLPKSIFQDLLKKLQQAGLAKLYHARLPGGESIASQLVLLGPTKFSATVCAGTKAEYLKLGASPFLRWKSFEALAALGYLENDLTDASLNSVTKFKSELGATLTPTWVLQRRDSGLLRTQEVFQKACAAVTQRLNRSGKLEDK